MAWTGRRGLRSRGLFRRGTRSLRRTSSRPGGMEHLEERRLLAVLYWDPDLVAKSNVVATGAGLGGSGGWTEGGAAVWFDPSLGGGVGGYVSWNSSRGDTAVFAGPAGGTVTISGSVSAGAIEVRGGAFTVTGGTFATPATGTTSYTAKGRASSGSLRSGSRSIANCPV